MAFFQVGFEKNNPCGFFYNNPGCHPIFEQLIDVCSW